MYDLTLVVHERMLLYPGDPAPSIKGLTSIAEGAPLTATSLDLGSHTGTHVDAPAHFLAEGRTLSDYAVDAFGGPAAVIDLERHANVSASALREHVVPEGRHVLLRTRNSRQLRSAEYDRQHAFVEPEAAEILLSRRPLSIGFDYYSVDSWSDTELPVHRMFAAAGLLVYVCLDLSAISAGECTFFGWPLRLDGLEASPVRAVALRDE